MKATEPLSPVHHVGSTRSNGTPVDEAPVSAVSWPAIVGGAFVAAAMGLILLSLGSGLGLSAISPWSNSGISSKTLGIAGAIWLLAMQAIAGALGGYVAGRLRTKWVAVHTEEVYFRDTAHGFLAWAVAVVISAGLLASAAAALVGAGAGVAGTGLAAAGAVAATTSTEMPAARQQPEPNGVAYYVDALFRTAHSSGASSEVPTSMEAGRIVAAALSKGRSRTGRQDVSVSVGCGPYRPESVGRRQACHGDDGASQGGARGRGSQGARGGGSRAQSGGIPVLVGVRLDARGCILRQLRGDHRGSPT